MRYASLIIPAIMIAMMILISCEKEPGEGGRASISGKVFVQDYNGNCTVLLEEYYGVDVEVYIIAGDDPSYFERVRTGPDGTYWFPYLRTGDYTVYAISEPCDIVGENKAVTVEVEITERKEEVKLEDIVIIK